MISFITTFYILRTREYRSINNDISNINLVTFHWIFGKGCQWMYLKILQQSLFLFFLRKNSLASIIKNKSGVKEQLCRQNVIQFSNSINNAELSLWLSRYFIFCKYFFLFSCIIFKMFFLFLNWILKHLVLTTFCVWNNV